MRFLNMRILIVGRSLLLRAWQAVLRAALTEAEAAQLQVSFDSIKATPLPVVTGLSPSSGPTLQVFPLTCSRSIFVST